MRDILSVEIADLARYRLRLTFTGGVTSTIDLTERLRTGGPLFRHLYEDPALFAQVSLDEDATTISWPNGADLAPEALHDSRYALPIR